MFTQPGFQVGMLMRRLIIDDEVDRQPWRDFLVDGFQKIKELVMAVFGYTRFDNSSRGNLQCSEQRGRSIALVIVCHGIPTPLLHRHLRFNSWVSGELERLPPVWLQTARRPNPLHLCR